MHGIKAPIVILMCLVTPLLAVAASSPSQPLPGYVVHFDFIANQLEARQLVRVAATSGARVINIVPPAHIWENQQALRMLDVILQEAAHHQLAVLFTRIDASYPPDAHGRRENYLYNTILTSAGQMPDGTPTTKYFFTTAGRAGYSEWMEKETRYYAKHYGKLPNLLGINLGPFSEPFASERGGFLQYLRKTGRYELTQYTPEAARLWHEWLRAHFCDITGVNRDYQTSFASLEEIPLPRSECDKRFGAHAGAAYFDFVRTINDWFIERYERCRRIWHEESKRSDVPFILQFSGFVAEKLAKARPGAAAFDLAGWITRADAVGLSLYTNSGYPDYGHASVVATVRLLELARDLGKDVFVLEGGCEAPNVVLNEAELRFFASAAALLRPKVWIYEFLKDKFNEEYRNNPGKLVCANGRTRPAAVRLLRSLFIELQTRPPMQETPAVAIIVDPTALRKDAALARASLALFDLAAIMPVRWATIESARALPVNVPCVRLGYPLPADELTRALMTAPEPETKERKEWLERLATTFTKRTFPLKQTSETESTE
jgi:hypothetical protein